jgi:hypothetical protein
MLKNTDKTVRKELEIGEKWRFSKDLERHFFAATTAAVSLLLASQLDVTPRDRTAVQSRRRAKSVGERHFFNRVATDSRGSTIVAGRAVGSNQPDERGRQERLAGPWVLPARSDSECVCVVS